VRPPVQQPVRADGLSRGGLQPAGGSSPRGAQQVGIIVCHACSNRGAPHTVSVFVSKNLSLETYDVTSCYRKGEIFISTASMEGLTIMQVFRCFAQLIAEIMTPG
jgi:hypothetical protein